jgi:hypothetical protein
MDQAWASKVPGAKVRGQSHLAMDTFYVEPGIRESTNEEFDSRRPRNIVSIQIEQNYQMP